MCGDDLDRKYMYTMINWINFIASEKWIYKKYEPAKYYYYGSYNFKP